MLGGSSRRWLLVTIGLAASACLAPTLPLPPPDPVVEPPDEQGNVRISGTDEPNALVTALNVRTGLIYGSRTGATGFYEFYARAEVGDELKLWIELGGQKSDLRSVLVPER